MPDFMVIEGGGEGPMSKDWQEHYARDAFGQFVIEILRGIARGDDARSRDVDAHYEFLRYANESNASPGIMIDEELGALIDRAQKMVSGNRALAEVAALGTYTLLAAKSWSHYRH